MEQASSISKNEIIFSMGYKFCLRIILTFALSSYTSSHPLEAKFHSLNVTDYQLAT
jgi:hypothetical protein